MCRSIPLLVPACRDWAQEGSEGSSVDGRLKGFVVVAVVQVYASGFGSGLQLLVIVLLDVALVLLLVKFESGVDAPAASQVWVDLVGKVPLVRDVLIDVINKLGASVHVDVVVFLLDAGLGIVVQQPILCRGRAMVTFDAVCNLLTPPCLLLCSSGHAPFTC